MKENNNVVRKRFFVIDGSALFLWKARGEVLRAAVRAGHKVIACAAIDIALQETQINDLLQSYKNNGIEFHELRMQRQGKNPLRELYTVWELWKLMRNLKPDLVLSYSCKSSLYGSFAATFNRVPNVYSAITGLGYLFVSTSGQTSVFKKILQRLLGIALAGNTKVFFQNKDDRDLFLQLSLLSNKDKSVLVNGSGVDLKKFRETPFPSGSMTFLMIARIQYHKGVVEYIEAARILKQRYPEVRFQLVGPFDDHPSALTESKFKKLIEGSGVEHLGGTYDVRPFIAKSHVYVLPSYREGTPLSALEAMAMGRPVVTTDVPGCRERS